MIVEIEQKLKMTFPTESHCVMFLENLRWSSGVKSPFHEFSSVYKCQSGKFKCRKSGKYFSVKTNSILSGSRLSLFQWMYCFERMENQTPSAASLASELGITLKSAYIIIKKINALKLQKNNSPIEQLTLTDWLSHLNS